MVTGKYERLSLLFSALLHVLALSAWVLAGAGGGAQKGVLMVDVVFLEGPQGEEGSARVTPAAPRAHGAGSKKAAENPPAKRDAKAAPPRHEMQEPPEEFFQERDESEDVSSVTASGEPDALAVAGGQAASTEEPAEREFSAVATQQAGETDESPTPGGLEAAGGEAARAAIIGSIRASIQKALSYPLIARKRGMEGTVVAAFAIGRDGVPGRIRLLRSSGHGMLDGEVMRTIARASPYPPLDGEVEVPVTFRLMDE